ncbi:hypothetical protein BDV32DRAFT_144673 [Aspergillus pseudonomiae]|nr:hypothetical protein BDV32DRAFT_144673 [Aspergillus pseudonomiae]
MILSKVSLLPLLGFIALTGAEVSPEVRTNIDNFKTNLDSTIAALHAYQGGVTGLATLMHSAYLTRQAIEQSKSHMQQTDQYSLDDSAEISNNTVAHFQSVVEFLNLIHTKLPLSKSAKLENSMRHMSRTYMDEDKAFLELMKSKLAVEHRDTISDGHAQVLGAYEALARAAASY